MSTRKPIWRHPIPWGASILLAILALFAACTTGPGGTSTSLAVATATDTASASATIQSTTSPTATTALPTATHSPSSHPTATPCPLPTATPTPRPRTTPSPTPRPTPTPTPMPKNVTVDISGFAFSPKSVTIPVGSTVTWVNLDATMHTTTSDSSVWNSGPLMTNATFSFTFTKPGTYTYHCAIHPSMTGTIIITA